MQAVTLELSGPLTLANARQQLVHQQQALREAAANSEGPLHTVRADLSGLSDVDTSALAVILQLDRDARARTGQPLKILGASSDLRSLARLSSLDSVLHWE